jgi:hypothetical protein
MRSWPVLLRLLLAIALVFNGLTTAMGSVHPEHVVAPFAGAQQGDEHAGASCHDDDMASPDKPAPSSPDCCKSGVCACTCVQHAPATLVAPTFGWPTLARVEAARRLVSDHVEPALHNLIRPPIGQA